MKNYVKKMPLVALLFCLAGCGSRSNLEGGAVKKGREITVEEAKAEMKVASEAMEAKDALSIHVDNANYSYEMNLNKNLPTLNSAINITKNEKLSKIKAGFGFSGLTSNDVNDVKGYGELSTDVDFSGTTTASGLKSEYKTPESRVSAKFYQDGATSYFDLSDSKLQAVFSALANGGNVNSDLKLDFSSYDKVAIPNTIEADDMPILTKAQMNKITYEITDEIEDIASRGGTVKALKHDDGTYSYSVQTKDLDDVDDFDDLIEKDFDIDDDMEVGGLKPNVETTTNVNTFSIAYVFDSNGIVSIGATIDFDYKAKATLKINNKEYVTDVSMKFYFDGKVNFDYNDKATIKEVTDKDTYKTVKADFELFD